MAEKKKPGKEIVKTQGNTPAAVIEYAIAKGASVGELEKLLTLQERYDANQARKVFTQAFSLVQEKIESVVKTKENPQTHSKYAPLEGVIESAKPIYTKEGFSVIFYEGETSKQDHIRICADVLHMKGHKETYHYDVPLDGVGIKGNPNMTKIHAKASSTSYARRYLMCMIWNIPTGDDDDAQASTTEYITDKQTSELVDMINEYNIDEKGFLKAYNIVEVAKLPKKRFQDAYAKLMAKKPGGKK